MQVDIRQAFFSDNERIFQIKKAAFKEYIDQIGGWVENDQRELHNRRTDGNRLNEIEILEFSKVTIGYAATRIIGKNIHLQQLFIDPVYQNMGLGGSYLKLLFVRADALDCIINSKVLKVNNRALRFYLRYGFKIKAENETHFLIQKSDNFIL